MKIHFASTAFHDAGWRDKIARLRCRAEAFGWEFGVQLHNTAPAEVIEKLAAERVPLSVHGPLNQDRFWNLARKDPADSFAAMARNFEYFRTLGIREVVFHAALMCDFAPEAFGHGKSYQECMMPVYRPELARWPGLFFNRDFASEDEFIRRFQWQKEHIHRFREQFPDFLVCVENDFPAFTGMNMFFRDLVKLDSPLCLDTGHLWISTHQAGMDFQQEIEFASKSGLLRMCHFHSSRYTSAIPAGQWSDGHQRLTLNNPEMDLPRAFRTLVRGGLKLFVLEIADADVEELDILHRWLEAEP